MGEEDPRVRERGRDRFFQDYASGALQRENAEAAARAWVTSDDAIDHDDDVDDFAAEMEEQGADPDAVAQFLAESEQSDDEREDDDFVVWPENAEAFQVFTLCHWQRTVVPGLEQTQIIFDGIAGAEIESVFNMLGVPAERKPTVLSTVRVMVNAALPLLNNRNG